MPFKSKAQMRFLYSQHPDIAKRWEDKYGVPKNMPNKIAKKKISQHHSVMRSIGAME